MKKIVSTALVLLSLFSLIFVPVEASENGGEANLGTIVDIEYLDDGSYIVTYLDNGIINLSGDGTNATVVTKSKTKRFYNSAGETMWYVKVIGTFSYTGVSCTCTEVGHSAGAPGSTWTIISASSSRRGNAATATATARHSNGTTYNDYTRSVTLRCSPTGEFT